MQKLKEQALEDPDTHLFVEAEMHQLREIFDYLGSLAYEDKPDYAFFRQKLREISELETDTSCTQHSYLATGTSA